MNEPLPSGGRFERIRARLAGRSWTAAPDTTVFHVTHPKAGSQWVYRVLAQLQPDRVVKPRVGNAHVVHDALRPGAVYPTVYLTRASFARLDVPEGKRTFVVIRDLRDTLISYYFSVRFSHSGGSRHISEPRAALEHLDAEAAIKMLLESKSIRFFANIQESWTADMTGVFRYEELVEDAEEAFLRIASHCQLPVSTRLVRRIVRECSFERLSGRERGVEDIRSHLRKGLPGDWRNHFTPAIERRFKELFGRTLVTTGYERDERW